jgi:Sec-independent protein translocase protein TatA
MAQKGGKLKRFILIALFLVLAAVVFVILGGGKVLRSAGSWLGGMGNKAEDIKGTIEQKATTIEKTVEKLKEGEKPGDKK